MAVIVSHGQSLSQAFVLCDLELPFMNLEEKPISQQRTGLRAGAMSPLSRREFGRIALAALPAASIVTVARQLSAAEAPTTVRGKPNSEVAGVQLGLNVPYSFASPQMSGGRHPQKLRPARYDLEEAVDPEEVPVRFHFGRRWTRRSEILQRVRRHDRRKDE